MAVDYGELKEKIRNALRGMNGVSIDSNGFYYCECDKDYRDELEDGDIADILAGRYRHRRNGEEQVEQMEPMGALNNLLADGYQDEMWRIEDEILEALRSNPDIVSMFNGLSLDEEQLTEQLLSALGDVWYVTVPVDEYLKQDVCMDIMLDTGDMNWGFACNNINFSDIESAEDFDDNSSLLWLCEQQGVTREELLSAFDKGTAHSDEVSQLRQRRDELVDALKQHGYKTPQFGERVWHTGAYQAYTKLQDNLVSQQAYLEVLREKYETNNLSYDEYLKKHFERFERLDPMSEEQFKVKKAEVLGNLSARIEKTEADLAVIQEKLGSSVDYAAVVRLQGEYKDVQRQLSELSKTVTYKKAEFIDSVRQELIDWPDNSTVMFLVKMPLETAIRLQEVIEGEASLNRSYDYNERTGKSSIVVGKDVRCGLINQDIGGGSVFGIALVEDVEIPVKAIYRAVPDCELGSCGFMSIYGMNDEPYEEVLKEIREVMPERVEDLIADAAKRVGNDFGNVQEHEIDIS